MRDKLSNNKLLRYFHNKIMNCLYLHRNKQIFSNLPKPSNKDGKIALFLTIRTITRSPQTYLEAAIAHALESAGLRVLMLHCDNVLDSCDGDTYVDLKKQELFCNRCKEHRKRLIKSLELEFCSYREYLKPDRLKQISDSIYSSQEEIKELKNMMFHGVNVGYHATSSVIRYFLTHSFDENNPEHIKIFKAKLYTACVSVELAHQLHSQYGDKIEHVIMVHGIYAAWGAFYDYFRAKNVDSVVYSLGLIHPGSVAFHRNGREWEMFYPGTWKKLKDRDLTSEENEKVDKYINDRFFNKYGVDLKIYSQVAVGEKKKVLDHLNSKPYKNRYVFYTHTIWDSVLENQSPVFNGFADMFNKTVEYFLKHTDKQLVIKIHPFELAWEKGSYSMLDYINTHFPKLSDNIYILPPSTPVGAYEIINERTIGLTYVGSVGYELPIIGTPVLVGGLIHYRNEGGVGVPVDSLDQYYALLDDPSPAFEMTKKNLHLARKWCYYYYHLLHFDLPICGSDSFARIDWKQMKNLRLMLADGKSALSRICKKIRDKADIINA